MRPQRTLPNVGIGRRTNAGFSRYVQEFTSFLTATGRLPEAIEIKWRGHAYLAAGTGTAPIAADGTMLVGDAAGLAYPESGEGIRPAVESGRLAAEVLIEAKGRHAAEDLKPYEDAIRRQHPPAAASEGFSGSLRTSIGRRLLQSRLFTRHVLLNRWFLRA